MTDRLNRLTPLSQGIIFMLFASFLFTIMGGLAKELSHSMSSIEVVFFRNVFGVIIVGYSIYRTPLVQSGGKFGLLLFRGVVGFTALLMFFYNIAHIPLAEAMTFSKTSPIFTAIFAYLILSERLSLTGWSGVFVGFIGILFITNPSFEGLSKYDYLGILSGVGAAMAYTSIRELRKHYETRAIVLSFMTVGTVGPIILMGLSEWYSSQTFDFVLSPFVMPSGIDWVWILLLGFFSTFAQIFMTKAYSLSKAGIIGTIGYSNIIFSIGIGLMLGDSLPDIYVTIGIVLIILSGVMVSKRSKQQGQT
jgi:drug/metabolite transporter (DMT)-like permease